MIFKKFVAATSRHILIKFGLNEIFIVGEYMTEIKQIISDEFKEVDCEFEKSHSQG